MSLLTQAYFLEKYGPRMDVQQLAAALDVQPKTVLNQVSAKTFPIPTYVDQGKRWADSRDVAAHFDAMRAIAA
ncbi:MAG TPA: hypothetical protein VGE36_13500 [Roseateles sp.]